jgi:hypothetical protein
MISGATPKALSFSAISARAFSAPFDEAYSARLPELLHAVLIALAAIRAEDRYHLQILLEDRSSRRTVTG